jgi:hypothetical protein
MGINEGGMVNGAMSRKVEITLNSAVSLVQTLQPLLFIPCYKSGGGWSGKCSETGEVTISLCGMKNSNHRHLLITVWRLAQWRISEHKTVNIPQKLMRDRMFN